MNNSKLKIYLDNCCFNRPFDDQSLLSNHVEALAKLKVQHLILNGVYDYIWSDILEFENKDNPYIERKNRIIKWKHIACNIVHSNDIVINKAKEFVKLGLKPKDSLHIASSIIGKCDYFLTTDKGILKKAKSISEISILNPVDFISEMEV